MSEEVVSDDEILESIAKIFEERGADVQWELDTNELLPPNSKYEPQNLEKVYDILDVWFDSGSTQKAVLSGVKFDAGEKIANMYLERSDQHRGWFQSSLLLGVALRGCAPYKNVPTYGFTVDEGGQKISKSKDNTITPDCVAKTYGVEILKLWAFLSDYSMDLKISENILKQVSEQYRKIHNAIRFLLANTNDLDNMQDADFSFINKWVLAGASHVFKMSEETFLDYKFAKGFNVLFNFLIADLSGAYLDINKDKLYCEVRASYRRKGSQTAMALIAKKLLSLLAPFLTYTINKALERANVCIRNDALDVFDLNFNEKFDSEFEVKDEFLPEVREGFFESIDKLKKGKSTKSALELILQTDSNQTNPLSKSEMKDWFTVSELENLDHSEKLCEFEVENESFTIVKARPSKYERCWRFEAIEDICPRYAGILDV